MGVKGPADVPVSSEPVKPSIGASESPSGGDLLKDAWEKFNDEKQMTFSLLLGDANKSKLQGAIGAEKVDRIAGETSALSQCVVASLGQSHGRGHICI